jgi:hypothetical protein
MKLPEARPLGLWLGGLYAGLGTVELVVHRDGELLFWGGSLVGGAALVVAGTIVRDRHRALGLTILTLGAVLGMNATLRTVLVPLFAVLVLVRFYRIEDAGPTVFRSPEAVETPKGPTPA